MADGMPVLSGLNLIVRDMDATLAFYRQLGLDIPDSAVWRTDSGAHHVDLSLPNGFGLDFDSKPLAVRPVGQRLSPESADAGRTQWDGAARIPPRGVATRLRSMISRSRVAGSRPRSPAERK